MNDQTPKSAAPAGPAQPDETKEAGQEQTPALDLAATLRELDPLDDPGDEAADDNGEPTVEALTADAFGEDSDASPGPRAFSVPTRQADPAVRARLLAELQRPDDDFDSELTTIGRVDGQRLDQAAARAEDGGRPVSPGEVYYRDLVEEEISFSRATGYDREGTAVVPLAELARREEQRLKREEGGPADEDTAEAEATPLGRAIPVGEIIDVLRAARTVEEVAGVLVEIAANLIPRVLLFWERHGRLYGFASRGMELTQVKLLTIELPKGLLQQMAACELDLESFQGPPNRGGMIDRLFELLGEPPAEVLLVPVQVTAEDRWLLYADNGPEPLPEFELRLLEVIASRAGARADWLLDKLALF